MTKPAAKKIAKPAQTVRSVRLEQATWDKLKRLGVPWLIRQIDRAKE